MKTVESKKIKFLRNIAKLRYSFAPILFSAILLFFPLGNSYGQGCCSASGRAGQVGVFQQSGLATGQYSISLYYENAVGDQLLEGSKEIADPIPRRSRLDVAIFSFSAGLPWRLSGHLTLPIVRRERSIVTGIGNSSLSLSASGLADPTLIVVREITPTYGWSGWFLTAGAGLQIPIGNDQRLDQGVPLPADIQPATGSLNLILLESVSKDLGDYLVYHHLSSTIYSENSNDYKFGNSVSADLGLSISRFGSIEPFVRLDLLYMQPDKLNSWELLNTGSTRWTVFPGVIWSLRNYGVTLSGQIGIPIHENVNGFQLGTNVAMLFGVEYLL